MVEDMGGTRKSRGREDHNRPQLEYILREKNLFSIKEK